MRPNTLDKIPSQELEEALNKVIRHQNQHRFAPTNITFFSEMASPDLDDFSRRKWHVQAAVIRALAKIETLEPGDIIYHTPKGFCTMQLHTAPESNPIPALIELAQTALSSTEYLQKFSDIVEYYLDATILDHDESPLVDPPENVVRDPTAIAAPKSASLSRD